MIVQNFKNYHLFGFTGTPIFAKNAGRTTNPDFAQQSKHLEKNYIHIQ